MVLCVRVFLLFALGVFRWVGVAGCGLRVCVAGVCGGFLSVGFGAVNARRAL